ncbi:MAG: response regulator [Oscillospiraceae bacterium]|jgi:putative two-component system response regulator|nr:response regulator [Oscillospiraceae bacterium]
MIIDKKTIIMVDDNLSNLTIGANALDPYYNLITLNSGARLLKALEKISPDLILLDVNMPDMNGFETISFLKRKKEYYHIPVIFLTAKSDSDSELEGLSLGAVDYIAKPFTPPLLLKRIELHMLIESQRAELLRQQKVLIAQKNELERFNANLQERVNEKTRTVLELQNTLLGTMANLVERRDNDTGNHIERTQNYLRILLNALWVNDAYWDEVNTWDIELLLQSAQLHDVGKISIDDSILRKPGKLTTEEYDKIKEHTEIGTKIIENIEVKASRQAFLEQARMLALTHHEKWDGSGYPRSLKGEEIPLQGRLMAIADVYDALISDRPYKEAFSHEHAVEIIKSESGSHFDPALVEIFLSVADKFKEAAN